MHGQQPRGKQSSSRLIRWTALDCAACVCLLFASCDKAADSAAPQVRRPPAQVAQQTKAQPRRANSSALRSAPQSSSEPARQARASRLAPGERPAPQRRSNVPDSHHPTSATTDTNRGLPTDPLEQATVDGERASSPPAGNTSNVRSTDGPSSGPPPATSSPATAATDQDSSAIVPAGVRRLAGKHLTLYTDVPSSPGVDELPQVFDLAIEPWCRYFHIDRKKVESWKMNGYLIQERERFVANGLLPVDIPPFLNGYQRGGDLWVIDQPSDYYRRHLLLHEGTHAFMQWQLRGAGPPWYMEGMAELLGTHRWHNGQLELGVFPRNREEAAHWGRIPMVRTEYREGRGMTLPQIATYGPTAHLQNEPYGWCWAAAAFLDGHPDFSRRFRQLSEHVRESTSEFDAFFAQSYRGDQRRRDEQWQLFVINLDYGYDLEREAIVYSPVTAPDGESTTATIRADRGWQSTGIQVRPGTTYQLRAQGRYQIGQVPKTWWCEPSGVTVRYHGGLPLGMLVAAVSDQSQPLTGVTPLAQPEPIGLEREIQFSASGTLFLRINDSPAELADNAGELTVAINPQIP